MLDDRMSSTLESISASASSGCSSIHVANRFIERAVTSRPFMASERGNKKTIKLLNSHQHEQADK